MKVSFRRVYKRSSYPSPVSAQQDCMCQGWSLMELRVRYLEISAADIQSFISCLLANINTAAFRRSWWEVDREDREQWSHKQWSGVERSNLGGKINAHYKNRVSSVWPVFSWLHKDVLRCYLMSQHPVELLFGDGQPLSVCAVDHQDDELQSRRQKSHRVTSFQKTFTAMKCGTAGGHFRGQGPHNGYWWLLC